MTELESRNPIRRIYGREVRTGYTQYTIYEGEYSISSKVDNETAARFGPLVVEDLEGQLDRHIARQEAADSK
jgi:hypothetical protein